MTESQSRKPSGPTGGASSSDPPPAQAGSRELRGQKPGDRRVRVDRPQSQYFRYTPSGALEARPKAHEERGPFGRLKTTSRRILFGRPLASAEEIGERLSKRKALAIFSSDAISSSAYATEEILRALLLAGIGIAALSLALPVAISIALLLAVVAISYRQVVVAYPTGGGSYSVSKANIGRMASLVAAAALLIDYVLTVAVSISSASEQIVSALPVLGPWHVVMAVAIVALITLANLRGVREAGNIFAVPTYLFVGSALLMIVLGAWQIIVGGQGDPYPPLAESSTELANVALVLLATRAFASGAVALTGTEAIATGVPGFKPPEPRNAATTLAVMAVLLATLFIGITFLASGFGVVPSDEMTVLSSVAGHVFGLDTVGFYLFLAFAATILMLAANTSFSAFPRLAAVLAEDNFFPRRFAYRGDRLAFTAGIVVLGVLASVLIIGFGGDTHALIPLYAVGVFIDFTISQSGMIRHWLRTRAEGWRRRLSVNAVGAVITALVAIDVTLVKAPASLVVIVLIPLLVALMWFIHHEYDTAARELYIDPSRVFGKSEKRTRVIVPIPNISRSVVRSVQFARALSDDVRAVHITIDSESTERLRKDWEHMLPGVPLIVIETPYRSLVVPFLHYLDVMAPTPPDTVTIVVLPEYVPRHWWDRFLHNPKAQRIRQALIGRHN
ncbi:MAG TPA: APC family permease, partial [Candidatus Limnocylindrales bacterium]|nr:APC family permease [Candidatus Limnocylindrales bacterium]